MTKVFVSAVVNAPIEQVWGKVRDFNGLPQWHPRFSRSHIVTYCILTSPLPVEGYVATLKLFPVTVGNKTLGVWTAEFRVAQSKEADVVEAVGNGTFGKAFEVLNEFFAARR